MGAMNATRRRQTRRSASASGVDGRTSARTVRARSTARRRASDAQTTTSAYSRYSTGGDRSTARRVTQRDYTRERKRRSRRRALIVLAVVVVLVGAGAGAAFAYLSSISSSLNSGVDDDLLNALVATDMAEDPFYVLILGVDSSEERDEDNSTDGTYRSDSIMLARIDPVNKKITLVSIHRDTLVDLDEYGQQKLNAAYAYGGAALAVETVSELAGVDISHYVEVNFDALIAIVDALGGIEVDVPIEIDDDEAGGYLAAGEQTLTGEQALILCRSRHAYDDYGDGDSYRAANQRLVLAAIAEKLLSSDVATIASTLTSLVDYVTTDMSLTDIIGVAQTLQGLDPDTDFYSATEPTTSAYVNGIWYEINDTEEWAEMMARVDAGLSPTEEDVVDESTGTILATTGSGEIDTSDYIVKSGEVSVRNGNGEAGVADEAAAILEEMGYTVDTGNADDYDYETTLVIFNDEDQLEDAQDIVEELGVGEAMINDGTYIVSGDFLVVVGADWPTS